MDNIINNIEDNIEVSAMQEAQLRRDIRRLHAKSPDSEAAWRRLSTRIANSNDKIVPEKKKPVWSVYRYAIAAVLVLCLFVGWFLFSPKEVATEEPLLVYSHNQENTQNVTLCDASGTCYVLQGDRATAEALQKEGIIADETNAIFLATDSKGKKSRSGYKNDKTNIRAKNSTQQRSLMTLTVPQGKIYNATLSDGTEVWLNSNSQLEFPDLFADDERQVHLRGEAYFKVAKNADHPFRVITESFSTLVLGTEFDVNVYNQEMQYVALAEGSVTISTDSLHSLVSMRAGQCAFFDNQGNTRVQDMDIYSLVQWRDNLFYFNDTDLRTVMETLGRWYNVDVYFADSRHLNTKLHFVADRTASLEEAIGNLNTLNVVKITIENNRIVVK